MCMLFFQLIWLCQFNFQTQSWTLRGLKKTSPSLTVSKRWDSWEGDVLKRKHLEGVKQNRSGMLTLGEGMDGFSFPFFPSLLFRQGLVLILSKKCLRLRLLSMVHGAKSLVHLSIRIWCKGYILFYWKKRHPLSFSFSFSSFTLFMELFCQVSCGKLCLRFYLVSH